MIDPLVVVLIWIVELSPLLLDLVTESPVVHGAGPDVWSVLEQAVETEY